MSQRIRGGDHAPAMPRDVRALKGRSLWSVFVADARGARVFFSEGWERGACRGPAAPAGRMLPASTSRSSSVLPGSFY